MNFQFKQFSVCHKNSAMKVGTDGVLLGAWANIKQSKTILDVGTGCGLIALMQAQKNNTATIHALDLDEQAYLEAKQNFENSQWHKNISAINTNFLNYNPEIQYDTIISNPPFFSGLLSKTEQRTKARYSNSLPLNDLLIQSSKLLSNTEYSSIQLIIPYLEYMNGNFSLFYEKRKCFVYPYPNTQPKRVLLELSIAPINQIITQETLHIQTSKTPYDFSLEYKNLTKDFYINF